jgi:dipeptidyl aminopeptidase/acylaminoacyl peptidase
MPAKRPATVPVLIPAILLLAAVAAAPASAQMLRHESDPSPPGARVTLSQAMADPEWIGPPVRDAWWSWDGQRAYYELEREGGDIFDVWTQDIDGGLPLRLDGSARADLDGSSPVYDPQRTRMAFVRNGDVFVRDLRSGALQQLTRTDDAESRPQWGADGGLAWRVGNTWYRWHPARGVAQASNVRAEDDPHEDPEPDALREQQMRLFETLRRERERRDAVRVQNEAWRGDDPTRAPEPVYLGKDVAIIDSALSPDGRWLLVVTEAADADKGKSGQMPKYITESGYEEFEEVRTRVGRGAPQPQKLWLVDVAAPAVRELSFEHLPGVADDPLAALRGEAGLDPLEGNRAVRVETDVTGAGPAIHWTADGNRAAVLLRAVDNKDRWIATVSPAASGFDEARLRVRHQLTDPAWINWNFNDFGWTADGALWLLSEQSGFSHLYLVEGEGAPRALTAGRWEASEVALSADGRGFLFLCNRAWPGDYEVCAVDRAGNLREVTALDGVESFELSPDGRRLLVRHSGSYLPPQLAVVGIDGDGTTRLTDTRSAAFRAIDWIEPEFVQVPSRHGAGTIRGKFYGPRNPEPGRRYPIVMFVHGAGYLQNVHERWPVYFREQMFHNLLVDAGYVVLDLDFRASEGYGRDWRTAIYRHMGEPELRRLPGRAGLAGRPPPGRPRPRRHLRRQLRRLHGVHGAVQGARHVQGRRRAAAGDRLDPVQPPLHLEHPQHPEVDPGAYRRSSPIELAENLQDHLLIAHGMIDNNVFYKDSVMLAQRLIELRKGKWELASYPLERHAYVHPESWYDQYRRIYELFDEVLEP